MFLLALKHGQVEYQRLFSEFESRLEALYRDMDQSYQQTAGAYGFLCSGCETSCCETRFYHHTLAEYFYLQKGFLSLDISRREMILQQARAVLKGYRVADEQQNSVRVPCPLNENGQCVIYPYRPMICRLHGIPHEFEKHSGESVYGPGCDLFNRRCEDVRYKKFDRTPFYRQMAALEHDLRQLIGVYDKFKMTIAGMLVLETDIAS
jgi:Fe-S-cluster containining protein